MALYRILHISDLHFSAETAKRGYPKRRLKNRVNALLPCPDAKLFAYSHHPHYANALAHYMYDHPDSYDIVVATGDLATTGYNMDLMGAHRFLCQPGTGPVGGRYPDDYLLNTRQKQIFLLPGNHDRYRPGKPLPGHTAFDAIFRGYWPSNRRIRVRPLSRRDGTVLILIAADFSLLPNDKGDLLRGYFGRGNANCELVAALENATMRAQGMYKERRYNIVWCIHFDPDAQGWLQLTNADRFLEAVFNKKLKVSAILCGHTHKAKLFQWKSKLLSICGATTECNRDSKFTTIEFDVDPGPSQLTKISANIFRYEPHLVGRRVEYYLPETDPASNIQFTTTI